MSYEEFLDGNKAITEFMGIKIGKELYSYRVGVYEPLKAEHLNYDGSWSWLMPAVKKIKDLDIAEFYRKNGVMNSLKEVDVEKTFKEVVKFVKWYNRQEFFKQQTNGRII